MTVSQILLLGLYVPMACLLVLFGLHRAHILFEYLRTRKQDPKPEGRLRELPSVLVQIPIYNERAVLPRILGAIKELDYPRDKLRIQVLDDSTDDTTEYARTACAELRARGLSIEHIHRPCRDGFKAGALANGLKFDDSELVAIFDADFVPPPDFLGHVVPYFAGAKVGMVQARWEHLNLTRNLLTRIATYFLDGHFILEHTYRHRTGRFFNFNGTAGVWRRSCIEDAGGWSASSITEDTEISFRALLRGWKFVYLRDLTVPAEVPADVDAFKSQQHRWAKGYTEVLREHLPTIWRAAIPFKAKLEATFMLSGHFAFLLLGALTILHLPVVLVRTSFHSTSFQILLDLVSIYLVLFAFFAFYAVSQWEAGRFNWRRLAQLPLAIGLGMALMVNSCRAVLEACFGLKTGFVRTPKDGDRPEKSYTARSALGQALVEVSFGIYLVVSSAFLMNRGHVWGIFLPLLVAGGFFYLGIGTIRNHWRRRRAATEVAPALSQPETASLGA
ncbi:MAG: glycosyltransferase [Planctomycetota bacterium]|nr:glycosyltransferase [Planctomycetota bacterium]